MAAGDRDDNQLLSEGLRASIKHWSTMCARVFLWIDFTQARGPEGIVSRYIPNSCGPIANRPLHRIPAMLRRSVIALSNIAPRVLSSSARQLPSHHLVSSSYTTSRSQICRFNIARMSSTSSSKTPHVSNLGHGAAATTAANGHTTSSNDEGPTFAVRHPSHPDAIVHTVQASTASDVSAAITAAHAAQKSWARTPLAKRREIILHAAHLLETDATWAQKVMDANKRETECSDAWAGLQIGWMGPQLRQLAASVGEALRMEVHEVGGE